MSLQSYRPPMGNPGDSSLPRGPRPEYTLETAVYELSRILDTENDKWEQKQLEKLKLRMKGASHE